MWEVNRLKGARFYDGLGEFTLDTPGFWDVEASNMYEQLIPVHFKIANKLATDKYSLMSPKLSVFDTETYSASIFCKTFDYTLFDGADPVVKLTLNGYETKTGTPTVMGTAVKNKADFPAQDWFRMKIENIVIPANIHYLELVATVTGNGNVLFVYPCIEFGDEVTELALHKSDIGKYYVKEIYEGVAETNELIKTQNISFNQVDQETARVQRNFYVLTCDEEGLEYYESEMDITADPLTESLEFRRERILNRLSNLVPYSFPFLQSKLDALMGSGFWNAYMDFPNYTLYIEYVPSNYLWSEEIKITVADVKPCNIVFINVAKVSHQIGISEQIGLETFEYNYNLGNWRLGERAFASFNDKGVIKMASTPSVQDSLLGLLAGHTVDSIAKVIVSDGTTSVTINEFQVKSSSGKVGTVAYEVSSSLGLNQITNIKMVTADDVVLTSSPVFISVSENNLITHTFNNTEVTS